MAEHVVGKVEDFPPGQGHVVEIGRLRIGIFNVDGSFHALPNICPHQYGPLCEGGVNGTMIKGSVGELNYEWGLENQVLTCPWHGIEFDITTGKSLSSSKLKVRQYQVEVTGDEVRVIL